MVAAAYRLMSTRGYMETKMADIAAEAGVSVQAVYFTFHSKPAVMRAAFEFAVKGDHLPIRPVERPWFAAMEKERDHRRALAIFVDACAAILHRVAPLAAVLNALVDDPEIEDFYKLSGRLQRDGYRIVIDTLARKRPLRRGLSEDDATTILLVLLGTDVYRSILIDHGWSQEKWRTWVLETLLEALFGQAPAGRVRAKGSKAT
jgi:AcrR family transcriptional regulator